MRPKQEAELSKKHPIKGSKERPLTLRDWHLSHFIKKNILHLIAISIQGGR